MHYPALPYITIRSRSSNGLIPLCFFQQREAKWIGQPVTEINSRNCKPNDFASYAGFWKAYQVEGANKEFWSFSATLFVVKFVTKVGKPS